MPSNWHLVTAHELSVLRFSTLLATTADTKLVTNCKHCVAIRGPTQGGHSATGLVCIERLSRTRISVLAKRPSRRRFTNLFRLVERLSRTASLGSGNSVSLLRHFASTCAGFSRASRCAPAAISLPRVRHVDCHRVVHVDDMEPVQGATASMFVVSPSMAL